MKTFNFFTTICLFGLLFLNACKGPEGPIGPQGPIGNTGTAGTNGTTGAAGIAGSAGTAGANGAQDPMGNANVVYSEWITPNWILGFNATDQVFLNNKETSSPLLTKDAIDKGLVYVYFKGNAQVYNQDTKEYELKVRINQNYFASYYKIPGRITNNWYDFSTCIASVQPNIGENYMDIRGNIAKMGYNETGNNIAIPELAGKAFSFYNDIAKDLIQYRIVVVNGSTKGRFPALDWSDYEAVKKALNLKN